MAIRESYKWPSKSPGDGGGLSRRVLLLGAAGSLHAQKAEITAFDLSLSDEPSVPNELFFVHDHFAQPAGLSSAGWRLEVTGAVGTPVSPSFDDLTSLPRKVLPVALECAENPVGGGLVSQAEWSGCGMAEVLAKAQPSSDARFVRLSGADTFSHTIPLAKALHPDTLLATAMNGEKLPQPHGFPLRALIPGWYGMASVKWLNRIEVLKDEPPAPGYRRQTRSLLAGLRDEDPVTAGGVKSVFSRPLDGAILTRRGKFIVRGLAWAGERPVRTVELTADGGKTWHPARLDGKAAPYAWTRWSWDWTVAAAGEFALTARATDDQSRQQPAERTPNRVDNYEWDAWQSVRVTVS
jgi:DMSO/TMAO reductase YedYZ molybdopterin-dependent catalytic subunit